MDMEIYALPGHKVKAIQSFEWCGRDYDRETAKRLLTPGGTYTVKKTRPLKSNTLVYLQEFSHMSPEPHFNSIFFEDVVEQSMEDTKRHPYYIYYHGGPEPVDYW